MDELRLLPGPRLLWQTYPMKTAEDVTDRAHEFLFETVTLDPAVTLADVMQLLIGNPVLRAVFRRDWADEICVEAAKGPLVDDEAEKDPVERIEYLELYSQWHLDSRAQRYDPVHRLHLHGIGPELEVDAPDYGVKKGGRIQWGVSCSSLRKLLPLPVRVRPTVSVREADLDAKAYGREVGTAQLDGVALGQVLHGLLWELSFHGGPQETQEFNDSLKEQLAEIEAGTVITTSSTDLFDDLYRAGCAALFETIGSHAPSDVAHALRDIDDAGDVVQALHAQFGDAVAVKPEFRSLPGREFRAAFREAKHADGSWLEKLRERVRSRQQPDD